MMEFKDLLRDIHNQLGYVKSAGMHVAKITNTIFHIHSGFNFIPRSFATPVRLINLWIQKPTEDIWLYPQHIVESINEDDSFEHNGAGMMWRCTAETPVIERCLREKVLPELPKEILLEILAGKKHLRWHHADIEEYFRSCVIHEFFHELLKNEHGLDMELENVSGNTISVHFNTEALCFMQHMFKFGEIMN